MTGPRIGLIWAEAFGGIIGSDGVMPWHLPEDLAHFKAITVGSPVVMGRKTWESLPPRFRPLPRRRNIVVTRQPDWRADGAEVAHSVDGALALAGASAPTWSSRTGSAGASAPVPGPAGESATVPGPAGESASEVWVIGGAQIFAAVVDRADRLEVTEVRARFDGDTTAPSIDHRWQAIATDPEEGWHTSSTGLEYRFLSYRRR